MPQVDQRLPVGDSRDGSMRPVSSTSRAAAPRPKTSPAALSRPKTGRSHRQIDAVDATTDLITITIGANDVGLPSDAEGCEVKSADPPPCTDEFVVGNVDRISEAITAQLPAWSALIDQLRLTAPHARIVVVGYGTFVRPGGMLSGAAGSAARRRLFAIQTK